MCTNAQSQIFFYFGKQPKRAISCKKKATVEATGDLIGNNIAHKNTKRSLQNTSETVKGETGIPKQRYIPPEKDNKLLMN